MPLATGVQILTCIGRLDILAHGFEFGGVGGSVGGLCCVIQHYLLLTCPEGLTFFIQTVHANLKGNCSHLLQAPPWLLSLQTRLFE